MPLCLPVRDHTADEQSVVHDVKGKSTDAIVALLRDTYAAPSSSTVKA